MKTAAERLAAKESAQMKARARRKAKESPRFTGQTLLREFREELRLDLCHVAKAVGISVPGLSLLERGSSVKLSIARKLSAFYGKSLDELWPAK